MDVEELTFNLFQQAHENIENVCNKFEEHFLWLEEVVVAAKKTFAHSDASLLPKTPAAKRRGRAKRTDSAISLSDSESFNKRSSIESIISQPPTQSPECAPLRKGRAAARIAQERVAKNLKDSNVRKLRRPSTPVDPGRTTKKIKIRDVESKRSLAEKENDPLEQRKLSSKSQTLVKVENCKVFEKSSNNSEQKIELISPQLKISSGNKLSAVELQDNKLMKKSFTCEDEKLQHISQEDITQIINSPVISRKKLCQKQSSDEPEISDVLKLPRISAVKNSVLSDVSSMEKEENNEQIKFQYDNEIETNKNEKLHVGYSDSSKGLKTFGIVTDELKEESKDVSRTASCDMSKLPENVSECLKEPLPKIRSTRTKQKEIVALRPSSSEDEYDSTKSKIVIESVPYPIPKPRTTRTKHKQETQTLNVADMEREMLPPTEIPVVILKSKVKENYVQKENDSESGTEENVSLENSEKSHLSLEDHKVQSAGIKKKEEIPEEVPRVRSTRTKKKENAVEPERHDSQSERVSESDDSTTSSHSRSTRTKRRQVEEQTTNPPSRSTRTKRRKMEEETEVTSKDDVPCLSVVSDEPKSKNIPANKITTSDKCVPTRSEVPSDEHSNLKSANENSSVYQSSTNTRVTRSKVRQAPVPKSPKVASPYFKKYENSPRTPNRDNFKRDCCTPKSSEKVTPQNRPPATSHIGSPLRSSPHFRARMDRVPYKKCDVLSEVEEVAMEDIEVTHSPARITRHSPVVKSAKRENSTIRCARKSLKRAKAFALAISQKRASEDSVEESPNTRWAKINPPSGSPSPQCPSDKIVRPKMGLVLGGNSLSGRVTPKTYSRIKPGNTSSSSRSSELNKTQKKTTTPLEMKRSKNIVTGITSFIKVQPAKPTREEIEEKRQLELQKKREREEDTKKKKVPTATLR